MDYIKESVLAIRDAIIGESRYIRLPLQRIEYEGGYEMANAFMVKVLYMTENDCVPNRGYYLFVTPCERTSYGQRWVARFARSVFISESRRNTEKQRVIAKGKAMSVLPSVIEAMAGAYGIHD